MQYFKNKTWILGNFITFVKEKKDRSQNYNIDYYYDIYIPNDNNQLFPEMIVYVGNTVQIGEDDNEIYPVEVIKMNFDFGYSCDNFQDVIDLATSQNPTVSITKLIECLNYYNENDTFLDI
ncbi:hypothetical protein [Flavobacterium sp. ACN6]|uniref:DUF7716 domain-containing protein n=1 Tax=Flavobacterium sp. ACN6 TaxID=1920426 RepID=UPI000BB38C05|nr:hypothetical protein [Flavobacterium sp. ACN6]PBJ12868.1 hypothetical protein BSF42_20490 [Flavobacterium sp. ACN6]